MKRFLVCGENVVLLRASGDGVEQLPTEADLRTLGIENVNGFEIDADLTGIALPKLKETSGFEAVGLRTLWSRLDARLFALAGRANQLVHFASTNAFCGRCGTKTERHPKERAFRCPQCGLVAYPRISPAIITLIRRGDEALLANSGRFPIPMFSTLAGFAEVGESLEETLAREVHEEVGIRVKNVRYFGSQPWPFPHSLMVGFTADYDSGEIVVDGEEIKEARFFKATELPMIPPKASIARALIDVWVAEVTAG